MKSLTASATTLIACVLLLAPIGCMSGPSGPPIRTESDYRRIAILPVAHVDMREGRLDGPVITAKVYEAEASSRVEAERAVKHLCRNEASIDSPEELAAHLKRISLHQDFEAYRTNDDPGRDRFLFARLLRAAGECNYDAVVRVTTAVSTNVGEVRATIGPWVSGETEVEAALYDVSDVTPVRVARGRGTYEYADGILYLFPFATGTRTSHAIADAMREAFEEVLPAASSAEAAADTAHAGVQPAAPH